MKTSLMVKALPVLFVTIYFLANKSLPAARAKLKSSPSTASFPSAVAGTVEKVMSDRQFAYALLVGQDGKHWVAVSTEVAPVVGQRLSCRITSCVEAYESQPLAMAFERVLFGELVEAV